MLIQNNLKGIIFKFIYLLKMEDLERMNAQRTNEIIDENPNNENNIIDIDAQKKQEGKLDNYTKTKKIPFEYLEEFINKVNNKEKIQIEDFYLYNKIKKCNEISPLMLFILEKSVKKYNGDLSNNGIEDTGFGYFPGITDSEIKNNKKYFKSSKAFVFYSTFSEDLIATFWKNHQLLSDLLGINPKNEVLPTKLNLAKTFSKTRTIKSNSKTKKKKNNKNKDINENSKNSKENENEKINNDKSDNNDIIIDNSSQNESVNEEEEEEKKRIESNNNEFYTFSLGENFDYNALHFLLYGISKYINLPRIVFYPLFDFKDYEEIDSVFIIKKMRTDIDEYYKNFKSFDIQKENVDDREEFKLEENDIVFIETTFDIEKKNKIKNFLYKIVKFIHLYMNKNLITSLNGFKIKPLVLYNNNYYLKDQIILSIKKSIEDFKISISKYKNDKFEEIYSNLRLIYCWPTIPIVNNYLSVHDLNKKIEKNEEKINELKNVNKELQNKINNLEKIIFNSSNGIEFNIKNINNKKFKNSCNIKNRYNNKNNIKLYYKYNNNYIKNNYNNSKYYYKSIIVIINITIVIHLILKNLMMNK